jgi:TRAP transporter 4TM/12TM fusion protein
MRKSLTGFWDIAAQLVLGGVALFYLCGAAYGIVTLQYHRGVALLYSLVAGFLLYRGSAKSPSSRPSLPDCLFILLAVIGVWYWILEHEQLAYRAGAYTALDLALGSAVTLMALEVARRVLGRPILIVALLALSYAYFGAYLPMLIGHRGFTLRRIIEYVYLTSDGMFGIMAEVVASYIIPFVVFGAFMMRAGVATLFMDVSMGLLGRTAGGPAQVAVFSSALFGSINGSPIANTATTGSITIPLMKRAGFPAHIAAAVEAAASTGGMILPPIMGAGAFIMAEMTRTPYIEIVKLSIVPGLLYFLSVGIMVHFESRKLGLSGLKKEELPILGRVLKQDWYLFLPIFVLAGLLIWGYSPQLSVVYATLATIVVSWIRPNTRMGLKETWRALVDGGQSALFVGAVTGAVGMIIGIVSLTGIGIRFSTIVMMLSGQSLIAALGLITVASFILGLGLPITAAYLVVAATAAPALTEFGLPLITAHLIIFWLSLDSNITPPVALGAYTAAAIAGADPWKTGWNSFRFAKLIYVMPLLFAYTHILFTGTAAQNAWAMVSAIVGTVAFSIMSTAFFLTSTTIIEWLALALATVLAFMPSLATDLTAFAIFAAVYLSQRRRLERQMAPALSKTGGAA